MHPRVLAGAITCDLYAYCLQNFLDAVRSFEYPSYDIFIVDNSASDTYAQRLKNEDVLVERRPNHKNLGQRIQESRNLLSHLHT